MAKQQSSLKYIYKIYSSRLRRSGWNLSLSLKEATENDELISLADSSTLRFIRSIETELKNEEVVNVEEEVKRIRKLIKFTKRDATSTENRNKIKKLYEQLYDILFVKSYVCIIIDNNQDFDRMNSNKGFYINEMKFKRLLATTGGAKNSTVVYIEENVFNKLHIKIENVRNTEKPLVPAKLEAYKALTCSASIPVSSPNGVLVIKDCKTTFKTDVIKIDDTEKGYPKVTNESDYEITINNSDGYGLVSPELSEKWSMELGEDSISSGLCIRNSWCKGMVFSFNFIDFAKDVAKKNIVIDAWGNPQDINQIQLVLTTSMLKLWDSYDNIDHYLQCCEESGYSFSVTKIIPQKLENERNLNYQFIQSIDLSDKDIDDLIKPTVDEIKDVMGGDYQKSLLFLKGIHLDEDSFSQHGDSDFIKALMVDKEMINDPFVKTKIQNMIKKRINEAKFGVLKVKGNFSTISGDPYSLCQSMFGMEITGLLKAGEFYSKYWNDRNVAKVACFRAPMTCHNNIRVLRFSNSEKMQHWYKHMTACTIFNSWDTTADSLNSADFDADSIMTTNSPTLLSKIVELPTIVCVQKTTDKKVVSELDLIQSNKNSFGDEIGTTTNRITSMFDVLARFEKGSKEYNELIYRITCGQNYQQNAIDKTKGIVSKSMPREWYSYKENKIGHEDTEEVVKLKEFNLSIMADKKPYFFIYIYPYLMREYKSFTESTTKNCYKRFGLAIHELVEKKEKTKEEDNFLRYYFSKLPVSISNSAMNKICRKIEIEFDNKKKNLNNTKFDFNILKSDKGYSKGRYSAIRKLYEDHNKKLQLHSQKTKQQRVKQEEKIVMRNLFVESFKRSAIEICNNEEELCNIVVDICYKGNSKSKQFAWDICGNQIIKNLLDKSNSKVSFPIQDENGNIEFDGEKFSLLTIELEDII